MALYIDEDLRDQTYVLLIVVQLDVKEFVSIRHCMVVHLDYAWPKQIRYFCLFV